MSKSARQTCPGRSPSESGGVDPVMNMNKMSVEVEMREVTKDAGNEGVELSKTQIVFT